MCETENGTDAEHSLAPLPRCRGRNDRDARACCERKPESPKVCLARARGFAQSAASASAKSRAGERRPHIDSPPNRHCRELVKRGRATVKFGPTALRLSRRHRPRRPSPRNPSRAQAAPRTRPSSPRPAEASSQTRKQTTDTDPTPRSTQRTHPRIRGRRLNN
jgi:hypothetical protein